MDEDNKKRFTPDTMEVTQELHLFAEWQSGIDTTYKVKYVLDADDTVEIADASEGHITADKTKTFTAKGMADLYEGYRTGYFPAVNSHSILMSEESESNTFTFRYVQDDEVWYLVITKAGANAGDSFLFRVAGTNVLGQDVDMVVSIQGTGSVTIQDLYCGDYTVTELTNWSWTYSCTDGDAKTVTLASEDTEGEEITNYEVTFTNSPKTVDWLHGESAAKENQFTINNP